MPVNLCCCCITLCFPYRQLAAQQLNVSYTAGQALPGHYIQLYFGDVQPTAVLWGIMYFQFFDDASCFLRRILLIEGSRLMGIEVVHYKDDFLSIRVHDIHEIFDLLRPVDGCTVLPHAYMVRPAKRLHKSKYADCSISDVFGIRFAVAPRYHRQGLPGLAQKLVRLFIHADNGTLWVIRKLIYIKDILHTGYEFRVFFCRDAPVVVFVRSKFVFFNAFRIASLLTGVSRMTLASSSSRRIVQREWPSGTGPQASSISRASTRPSTLRLALSEFMLLLNSVTALTPPFMYFVTVFVTVARQTPLDLALCSWVRTFPCDSSRSRIIWHLQRIVFEVAFLRIMDLSSLYSSSVSLITYFLGLAIGITAVFS